MRSELQNYVHTDMLLEHDLRQKNPLPTLRPYFFTTHFNTFVLSIPNIPRRVFPSDFGTTRVYISLLRKVVYFLPFYFISLHTVSFHSTWVLLTQVPMTFRQVRCKNTKMDVLIALGARVTCSRFKMSEHVPFSRATFFHIKEIIRPALRNSVLITRLLINSV